MVTPNTVADAVAFTVCANDVVVTAKRTAAITINFFVALSFLIFLCFKLVSYDCKVFVMFITITNTMPNYHYTHVPQY